MKEIKKRMKSILLVLGLGGGIGFVLLFLVYLLPVNRIMYNADASIPQFEQWGWDPHILEDYESTTIDTYTDAWMIRIAYYDGDESVLQKCLNNYYFGYSEGQTTNVIESMISYLRGVEGYHRCSYGRYWHGYLVILKPLLCFFEYGDIIGLLKFVQIAMVAYCCVLLERKKLAGCFPCIVAMLVCVEYHMISMSMQFSWVFMVAMISSIYLLKQKEESYYDVSVDLAFLITGMCTSYLDFLTYPIFTLGIPLTIMLIQRSMSYREGRLFCTTILDSLYWAVGYGGMWFIKWVLCTVLTDENVIADGIQTVLYRSGLDASGESMGYLEILARNIQMISKYPYLLAVVCAAAAILLGGSTRRFAKVSKETVAAYLFAACLPFFWYAAVKQHSYTHYVMTYRNLGISIFALLCFLTQLKKPIDSSRDMV